MREIKSTSPAAIYQHVEWLPNLQLRIACIPRIFNISDLDFDQEPTVKVLKQFLKQTQARKKLKTNCGLHDSNPDHLSSAKANILRDPKNYAMRSPSKNNGQEKVRDVP